MPESTSATKGVENALYNTLSNYLPDDFPPGPPFTDCDDMERYKLIRGIEDFNYMNTGLWGKSEGKSHGFLHNKVPISFNWLEFARTYGPELDKRFSDPREAMLALKNLYLVFGFGIDNWRKNRRARKAADLLYDQALRNLVSRHKTINDGALKKYRYKINDLTKIMFSELIAQNKLALSRAQISDTEIAERLNPIISDLESKARYVKDWPEVRHIIYFTEKSDTYIFLVG